MNVFPAGPRWTIDRLRGLFSRFAAVESSGGIVLMVGALIALLWANSPWAESYDALWHLSLGIWNDTFGIGMSLQHWINDGLMVIFFFVVGLEIKRELLVGELASVRKAALPIAAAIGGMIVPALLYLTMNTGHAGRVGWGIPMATDIAFAIGVLTLLGSRVPVGLKVFLMALAIVDDLGAVLVIALFYTSEIAWLWLALSFIAIIVSAIGGRLGIRSSWFFAAIGLAAWICMLQSGVHATIAGVLMAFTIRAPFNHMERALHGIVTFAIMPVFALANAGVSLGGIVPTQDGVFVATGIILGLVIGKPLGITLFAWASVRFGMASLPEGASWKQLHGVSWLGGIGFTMSLFVAGLAFGDGSLLGPAKIGILAASAMAGIIGWMLLSRRRVV